MRTMSSQYKTDNFTLQEQLNNIAARLGTVESKTTKNEEEVASLKTTVEEDVQQVKKQLSKQERAMIRAFDIINSLVDRALGVREFRAYIQTKSDLFNSITLRSYL